jgi:hypothetical protein
MGMVNYLNKLKNYCLPSFLFFPITSNRHARESGQVESRLKCNGLSFFMNTSCGV